LIPIPLKLSERLRIDPYKLMNPNSAGPRKIAIAFVRTIPMVMFTIDEPAINTDDFRI